MQICRHELHNVVRQILALRIKLSKHRRAPINQAYPACVLVKYQIRRFYIAMHYRLQLAVFVVST